MKTLINIILTVALIILFSVSISSAHVVEGYTHRHYCVWKDGRNPPVTRRCDMEQAVPGGYGYSFGSNAANLRCNDECQLVSDSTNPDPQTRPLPDCGTNQHKHHNLDCHSETEHHYGHGIPDPVPNGCNKRGAEPRYNAGNKCFDSCPSWAPEGNGGPDNNIGGYCNCPSGWAWKTVTNCPHDNTSYCLPKPNNDDDEFLVCAEGVLQADGGLLYEVKPNNVPPRPLRTSTSSSSYEEDSPQCAKSDDPLPSTYPISYSSYGAECFNLDAYIACTELNVQIWLEHSSTDDYDLCIYKEGSGRTDACHTIRQTVGTNGLLCTSSRSNSASTVDQVLTSNGSRGIRACVVDYSGTGNWTLYIKYRGGSC